jgi:hypothetical protein
VIGDRLLMIIGRWAFGDSVGSAVVSVGCSGQVEIRGWRWSSRGVGCVFRRTRRLEFEVRLDWSFERCQGLERGTAPVFLELMNQK